MLLPFKENHKHFNKSLVLFFDKLNISMSYTIFYVSSGSIKTFMKIEKKIFKRFIVKELACKLSVLFCSNAFVC